MINLKRIHLEGFKNIETNTIILDDVTGIISLNNYGKSNFMSGIAFGFRFIQMTPMQKANAIMDSFLMPYVNKCFLKDFLFLLNLKLK